MKIKKTSAAKYATKAYFRKVTTKKVVNHFEIQKNPV